MNFKIVALALLVAVALARTYPLYKQCDPSWGSQQLGTSANTICKAGCAMSSVAMALGGIGKNYNPGTLNTWLKANGGYVSGDLLVWGAVGKLGLSYQGKITNAQVPANVNAGHIVVLNVHNGGHWVLATSMASGSVANVHDPGYSTTQYSTSEVVGAALYHVSGVSSNGFLGMMIDQLEIALNVNGRRDKMMEADGAILEQ